MGGLGMEVGLGDIYYIGEIDVSASTSYDIFLPSKCHKEFIDNFQH